MMINKTFFFFVMIFLILGFFILFVDLESVTASTNGTMVVEANILGFGNISTGDIGIEVPDFISLGDVKKIDPVSDEKTITINNIGKTKIIVTPQLKNPNEKIFKWLFFRTQKSSSVNSSLASFYKIGNYSIDIDEPALGNTKRSKNIYMLLNLTDFTETLNEDLINYKTEVTFLAMPG